ncbi:c33171a0-5e6e-4571-9685-25adedfb2e77 [Thermothielavioides terrestris]|uniref:Threonylcarbamoyl-AMP synthase n=1 Tax=Thermothielavioides terrestris TaxID=2587410 RepID=A0A3S4EXD7_9PEZI|nr:c33171a0-5e6e-4571-9685-25adedfb2e77 [Thermothielavioides terrestris]
METRILKVPLAGKDDAVLGRWATAPDGTPDLNTWEVPSPPPPPSADPLAPLREAAHLLRTTPVPVAFPTETVYGLGADATRSDAVRGIFAAKGRPADNPLIVHISDLSMLRRLLTPSPPQQQQEHQPAPQPVSSPSSPSPQSHSQPLFTADDPIPAIYHPLITRFWPGPLTILLPRPTPSPLAPEVTASQPTFGARLPASALARTLIALAGAPLAAPSANASTRPSPTAARHVRDDLRGRVALVLDGGACAVGVESTVVDGLCVPPAVLRPGGVGIEELRSCPGWEGVVKAYEDREHAVVDGAAAAAPRAPGMKYKHYSPRARVVLFEAGGRGRKGVVGPADDAAADGEGDPGFVVREGALLGADGTEMGCRLLDVDLGEDVRAVAHGLFAALRELDSLGADVIFVEGVSDGDDIAAAVMNRLRKAASEIRA